MKNRKATRERKVKNDSQKVTIFLTFTDRAEEAVHRYVSVFKNSRIVSLVRSQTEGPIAKGKVLNATFELDGQRFMAMDGGPSFSFSQGTSLFVNCETQQEIDRLWEKLSEGGEKQPCGWLKDEFGVSWQIVPTVLGEMMSDPKSGNSGKVMEALLQMSKIDIKRLQQAYAGRK
jgi:predicted 3-demethylubiquinone-9 3-methyltransferase (glyoxalase superfamily)